MTPEPMGGAPVFYLTLDVEPDYARTDRHHLLESLPELLRWSASEAVPVTAFVVGRYFDEGRPVIDTLLNAGADLELHGHRHDPADFGAMNTSHAREIEQGFAAFHRSLNRPPAGYRAPSGIISSEDMALLAHLGFSYDASIFPVRRPGRYDFTRAPRRAFRWREHGLLELPCGLLTERLPAGMTFLNWFGASWGAGRLRARAKETGGHTVFDSHLHNLFHHGPALRELPFGLRLAYHSGRIVGGFKCLRRLVTPLRAAGWTFGSLTRRALALKSETALPTVAWTDVAPVAG